MHQGLASVLVIAWAVAVRSADCSEGGCSDDSDSQALLQRPSSGDVNVEAHVGAPAPAVQRVMTSIKSPDGVLLKFLASTTVFPFAGGDATNWRQSLTDCSPDAAPNDCSAWNFFQQGKVPIVYSPPLNTHGIGIIVENNTQIWKEMKYLHVSDAVTLGRVGPGTVYPDFSNEYPKCPNGQDPSEVDLICTGEPAAAPTCQKDATKGPNYYYYKQPIGVNGEDWVTKFMSKVPGSNARMVTRSKTSEHQCGITYDYDNAALFLKTLDSFYSAAISAPADQHGVPHWASGNWADEQSGKGGFYLENEINMLTKANELADIMKPYINAVWVQLQPCADALYNQVDAKTCQQDMTKGGATEDQVIQDTVKQGCDLAKALQQFTGRDIPVFSTTFANPYFPNTKTWADFIKGPEPGTYMKPQVCH